MQFRQYSAFTLMELLITLAIGMVLTAAALPSFFGFDDQKATALANTLVTCVHFARTQALVRQQSVQLCPSADGVICGQDWLAGHVLVTTVDAAGKQGELLFDISLPRMSGMLSWRGFGVSTYPRVNASGDSFQYNGSWYYCEGVNAIGNRRITLSTTGKVSVATMGDC